MKRIVYIVSHVDKSLAFEWIALSLKKKYRISFILLNPHHSLLEEFLISNGIEVRRFLYRGKKDAAAALIKVFWYLVRRRPDAVHIHLIDAQLIGLPASLAAGIRKRIYTRHNSNFHHVYAPQGVKYDRISNWLATHIVSISQSTLATLLELEGVPPEKIRTVPHGFDLSLFHDRVEEHIQRVKEKWRIPDDGPVIGVVARHIEWKGIQYIIPAFIKLLERFPDATLVLANAHGPYHHTLLKMLEPISTRYILIPFEPDIPSLYHSFDIYVHTPVDALCEAFGQTYIEALAAGVPSIFTRSGIAQEFIEHRENAWVADFRDSDSIYRGIRELLTNQSLTSSIKSKGWESVRDRFSLNSMISKLEALYDE